MKSTRPKKKTKRVDGGQKTAVCVLRERFDISKLQHISKLDDLSAETEGKIANILKNIKNHSGLTVPYSIGKNGGSRIFGNGVCRWGLQKD